MQDETHNKTPTKVWTELRRLMDEHPDAKIVTDVGASMISGWGELRAVVYYEVENTIELEFD